MTSPTPPPADGIVPQPMPFAFDFDRGLGPDRRFATVLTIRTLYGALTVWLTDDISEALEAELRRQRGGLHIPPTNGTRPA